MTLTLLSVLTYALVVMGIWAAGISAWIIKSVLAKCIGRKKCRKTDIIHSVFMILSAILAFVVVFIHPGIIYMIPSTIATFVVGSIPIMIYLTEKHLRDGIQLKRSPNH
jgi:predicted membrane protein